MKVRNTLLAGLVVLVMVCGCSTKEEPAADAGSGVLVFQANGEDFVRQGFIDKQGWRIDFNKLYVNIVDPTVYGEPGEQVLKGAFWLDLAAGDENADLIPVGELKEVPAGNYQSLKFKLRRKAEGDYAGSSIVMLGTAAKDGKTVPFEIRLDEEMDFDGQEGYVGDSIKGLVPAGGSCAVEMTFHFDHIFGDVEAEADSHINTDSVGFDFFNTFAADGAVKVTQEQLRSAKGYDVLCKGMWTLGHLGEGHCECTNQTSAQGTK